MIVRRYDLEVAHFLLAGVGEHHKCRRLHGHRYELLVWVDGPLDEDGMLIEYDVLDSVLQPVLRAVDHNCLNTLDRRCTTAEAVAVAANPTVERLVLWFAARLEGIVASAAPGRRLRLAQLRLQEDAFSGSEWRAG